MEGLSATNDTEDLQRQGSINIPLILIKFIISLLIVLANILNLVVLPRLPDFNEVRKVFHIALSITDLGVGIVIATSISYDFIDMSVSGHSLCTMMGIMTSVAPMNSVGIMCLLHLDRFLLITKPLRYPIWVTPRKAQVEVIVVCVSFMTILLICIGVSPSSWSIIRLSQSFKMCMIDYSNKEFAPYAVAVMVLSIWMPAVILVAMYIKIIRISLKAKGHLRRVKVVPAAPVVAKGGQLTGTRNGHSTNNGLVPKAPKINIISSAFKSFKMPVIITCGFFLAWGPFSVYMCYRIGAGIPYPSWGRYVVFILISFNSFWNVVLYVLLEKSYREKFFGNENDVGESLAIVSPNYPDNYPNRASVQWLVAGPADYQLVAATFHSFELESGYDFLSIGSGLNSSDQTSLLATLSGSILPEDVVSINDKMWLHFTSDKIGRRQGFNITFSEHLDDNHTGEVNKHPVCSHCNGGPLVTCPYHTVDVGHLSGPEGTIPESRPVGVAPSETPEPERMIYIFLQINNPVPTQTLKCLEGFELVETGMCVPIPADWPVCLFRDIQISLNDGSEECLVDMSCFRQDPPCLGPAINASNESVTYSLLYEDYINPSLEIIQKDIIRLLQTPSPHQCSKVGISASQSCYLDDRGENTSNDCPEEVFPGDFSDFTPSPINNESLIFTNGTYVRPRWWSNITYIEFDHANVSTEYDFILCGTEIALQTCSFFVVSNDSVEWIYEENQSAILHQGQMYDTENILINPDGSISICYIDLDTRVGGRAQMILEHVLLAISSVCLFATLITYFAFPTLRNRQGVSIMNFITALFLGQIFLQYIRRSLFDMVIPCLVVAALSHFFFLSSFVWTTIIAWDLNRSLASNKMKSFSPSSFGRNMRVFLLVGWGTPLASVLITLIFQFGGFQNAPILKYDSKVCWLAKQANIAMFFVPMSACLLSNLILFIITVNGVHSTKKSMSMMKQGQESPLKQWIIELKIYIKISVLLGFAWLFGFLALVINLPVTEYLFIIVISLQGVFVFISFGANKRVRKLWRACLQKSTLWAKMSKKDSTGTHNGNNNGSQ